MKNSQQIKALIMVLLLSISVVSCQKTVKVKPLPPAPKTEETKKPVEIPTSEIVPSYEVIKKTNEYRKDSGTTYFIIIRPPTQSPDILVAQIKNLVKKIVKTVEKKENVTIEIFDSLNALDWVVNKKSSTAPLLKTRYIAKFVGASSDEVYRNTLYMYPASTKDTHEFDPSKG